MKVLAAVSPGGARELERHYPGVPVALTPNGIDADRFKRNISARGQLRQSEGVQPSETIVLFLGGDWDRKGLDVVIGGLAQAERLSSSPLTLWVVGSGDRARFQDLAARWGVAGRVRFFGVRSDTERFYSAADVFVNLSLYETFSLSAYEAAAAALPIVGTNVSGLRDLVADDAGCIVGRDPLELGKALAKLASDPHLRRRLGAAGLRRASQYTWNRSVQSVLDLYEHVAWSQSLDATATAVRGSPAP